MITFIQILQQAPASLEVQVLPIGKPFCETNRVLRREGSVVLERLLDDRARFPFQESVNLWFNEITESLFQEGSITHKFKDRLSETRLAELFYDLTDQKFLKFGRSWRDRILGRCRFPALRGS